jgi:hypothetical protein
MHTRLVKRKTLRPTAGQLRAMSDFFLSRWIADRERIETTVNWHQRRELTKQIWTHYNTTELWSTFPQLIRRILRELNSFPLQPQQN